jgi:hypothetical protein
MHWESDAGSCRKAHQSKFTPSACLTCHRGPICVWYRSVLLMALRLGPNVTICIRQINLPLLSVLNVILLLALLYKNCLLKPTAAALYKSLVAAISRNANHY